MEEKDKRLFVRFVEWFEQQVRSRWPKCEFNEIDLHDWFEVLKHFPDRCTTRAVFLHRIQDDPTRPSIKKVRQIAAQLAPARPYPAPRDDEEAKGVTFDQFWENVRNNYSFEDRIKTICQFVRWHPSAAARDIEAYKEAVRRGFLINVSKKSAVYLF